MKLLSDAALVKWVIKSYLPIVLFTVCAPLVSCTTTNFLGKTYPPTQHVDVFFSPHDVRHNYEVMGEIHAQADDSLEGS